MRTESLADARGGERVRGAGDARGVEADDADRRTRPQAGRDRTGPGQAHPVEHPGVRAERRPRRSPTDGSGACTRPSTATLPSSSCSVVMSRASRVGASRIGAAVHAGVHGVVQHGDLDDAVHQPAQGRGQPRDADRPVGRVGDDDDVRRQQVAVRVQEVGEGRRADLLLALDEHRDPDAQLLAQHAQRADVRDDARLVVRGTAAVEAAVALGGLEGRAVPVGVVAGRLDVVVRVQQHRRRTLRARVGGRRPRARHPRHREHLDVVEAGAAQERQRRRRRWPRRGPGRTRRWTRWGSARGPRGRRAARRTRRPCGSGGRPCGRRAGRRSGRRLRSRTSTLLDYPDGVFGRSNDPQPVTPALTESTPSPTDPGKGRPTPKRKVSEAANKRPLVAPTTKKTSRAQAKAQRDVEYRAMQTGDERNMPAKDRGPGAPLHPRRRRRPLEPRRVLPAGRGHLPASSSSRWPSTRYAVVRHPGAVRLHPRRGVRRLADVAQRQEAPGRQVRRSSRSPAAPPCTACCGRSRSARRGCRSPRSSTDSAPSDAVVGWRAWFPTATWAAPA